MHGKPQAGSTLVEIAIVLLVVGLLLGGVMKGQALIDSARVKNLAQDLRSVPAMIHAYQDRFRALPGDDPALIRPPGSRARQPDAASGLGFFFAATDDDAVMQRTKLHCRSLLIVVFIGRFKPAG